VKHSKKEIALILVILCSFSSIYSQLGTNLVTLKIKPSRTDSRIKIADSTHFIAYDSSKTQKELLLFLPGTRGIPERGPMQLFKTATSQGLRVINLSYSNNIAVARICRGENLENDSECTRKFREKRVFGTNTTPLISDEHQDAIVNRLHKLLLHLEQNDPKGNWGKYLDNKAINWKKIIVSGQSQGGGMAAFIAKKHDVARIITFSGGWDYSAKDKIATWYSDSSKTPTEKWFGTYHVLEPKALIIKQTLKAMQVPDNQIYALDLKTPLSRKAHNQAIRNVRYKKLWLELFSLD